MCSHPGYTNGVLTPSYAILTDACISKRNWGVEVFEETQGTLKAAAATLAETSLMYEPQDVVFIHPRNAKTLFGLFEATSQLALMATHPELFPRVVLVVWL